MSQPRSLALAALPVAGEWFSVEQVADGIWAITEPRLHPMLRANAYLVRGGTRDLLVDAGDGLASIQAALKQRGLLRPELVAVATHTHFDHIGGLHEIETRLVHQAEADGLAEPEPRRRPRPPRTREPVRPRPARGARRAYLERRGS